MLRTTSLILMSCAASPALAFSIVAIPEPGQFGLFALGIVGLLIGRRASRRR